MVPAKPSHNTDAKRRTYLFILWFIPTVFAAAILTRAYHSRVEGIRAQIEMDAMTDLVTASERIQSDLRFVEKDLLYLAGASLNSALWDTEGQDVSTADILHFSAMKQAYDQVRMIDTAGLEVMRVNFNQGSPSLVPSAGLQNKSARPYFTETIGLAKDELYVSPMDLNIEHGELEEPPKPVIRFATPVFDAQGEKRGILVFNYLGHELLDHLQDGIVLLNSDGHWLHGGASEKLWGFMYGSERTFASERPEQWARMSATEHGHIEHGELLTSFRSVPPLQAGFSWKLVIQHESPRATAAASVLLRNSIYTFVVSTALLAAVALLITRRWFDARDVIIAELRNNERQLVNAMDLVNQLSGLLPICANCKAIRDDRGYWNRIESYISKHSEAEFSHSVCPNCIRELYPDFVDDLSSDDEHSDP